MYTAAPAFDRFISALEASGRKVKQQGGERARAQCPAHDGNDLNLSVAVGDQGVLLKCHSHDCHPEDIARAVGLQLTDLFDAEGHAVYDYGGGHRVYRTRAPEGKKNIRQEGKPKVTSLYRHPDSAPIEESEFVVVVEGEKCVDSALRLGMPCVTTWPGGSAAVAWVDLDPLAGKRIRLIADNDEPGHRAMARLSQMLGSIATVEGVWTAPGAKESVDDIWLNGGELADLIPLDITPYIADDSEDEREFVVDFLSEHKSRAMRWLWNEVIPNGAAIIFAGMGGVSKSTFALWLAGRITRGLAVGCLQDEPANVLYVSHEDAIDEVVLPRAQVNGVDTSRFARLGVRVRERNGVSMPRFPEDIVRLENAILATDARLIIVDPVVSTMPAGSDPNAMVDVRATIDPLNELAQRLGVSIICIAHTNKSATNARTAVTGSGAWVDATRGTLTFVQDEPDPAVDYVDVTFGHAKSNYAQNGLTWTYRLFGVDHEHDDGSIVSIPKIQFLGRSQRSLNDVMNGGEDRRIGFLSQAIREFIDAQTGAVTARAVLEEFSDQTTVNVRMTLSRLVKSGKIDSPDRGIYQPMRLRPDRM